MKDNGLIYNRLKSKSNPINIKSDDDILINAPTNAWFIAYLFHRVVIGKVQNKKFIYYNQSEKDVTISNIQKLRIFNKDSELFIWRTSIGEYKSRLRIDNEGLEHEVIDARQILFGTVANPIKDGSPYSCLTEKRGTEIILPLSELKINDSEINNFNGRLCIHTRSYIGFIENTGQATYEDVRFVEFEKYKEEK